MEFSKLAVHSVVTLSIIGCGHATAQDSLDEIFVMGTKMNSSIADMTQAVSIIDANDISAWGYQNLTEILRHEAGLEFKQSGAPGQFNTIKMRGFASGHVLVLVDGARINEGSSGSVGNILGQINPDSISRIEVLRGPQATLYGSNSTAGVVSITSKTGGAGESPSIKIEGGSMGWKSAGLALGGELGSGEESLLTYAFNYNNDESDGVHQYEFLENQTWQGKFQFTATDFYVGASMWRTDNRFGFAELDEQFLSVASRAEHWAFQTPDPHQTDSTESNIVSVFAGHEINTAWSHNLVFAYEDKAEHFVDVNDGQLGSVLAPYDNFTDFSCDYFSQFNVGELVPVCDDSSDRMVENNNRQLDYNVIYSGKNLNLLLGVEYNNQESVSNGYDESQEVKSIYFNSSIHGWNEDSILTMGIRRDDYDVWGVEMTASIGFGYDLSTSANIFANYGSSFSAPNGDDLFGIYGGNLNLQPESGKTLELGIRGALDKVGYSVNYWDTKVENVISYDGSIANADNPFGFGLYVNEDKQESNGVEMEMSYQFSERLAINSNYTYTDSKTSKGLDTVRTVQVADHKGNLGLRYQNTEFGFGVNMYYSGPRLRWAGDVEMDSYVRVDLNGSYRFNNNIRLYSRLENIFDENIEEGLGYKQPGVLAFVGIEYKL